MPYHGRQARSGGSREEGNGEDCTTLNIVLDQRGRCSRTALVGQRALDRSVIAKRTREYRGTSALGRGGAVRQCECRLTVTSPARSRKCPPQTRCQIARKGWRWASRSSTRRLWNAPRKRAPARSLGSPRT
jgi:hypothetical protein